MSGSYQPESAETPTENRRKALALRLEEARRKLWQQLADFAAASDPSDPAAQQEARERLRRHDREGAEELAAEFREKGVL